MNDMGIKDFLSVNDLTGDKIEWIFKEAERLKKNPITHDLRDKNIALIFAKSSTRTRVS